MCTYCHVTMLLLINTFFFSLLSINRGFVYSSGFVESSTDVCGNGVSSSPVQITLALGMQEVSVDNTMIKSQWNCHSCSVINVLFFPSQIWNVLKAKFNFLNTEKCLCVLC